MKLIIGLFLLLNLTNTFATSFQPTCAMFAQEMVDARMAAKQSQNLEDISKYLDFSITITGMCIEEYNVRINGAVSDFAPTQAAKELLADLEECGYVDILDGYAHNYMEVADCNYEVFRRAARVLNIEL